MENQAQRINNDEIEIDLLELARVLLHKAWLIILIGILTAAMGFGYSRYVMKPVYDSTTKIYVLNKKQDAAVTYSDMQLGTQLTKDYAELINSRYVLEKVSADLGLQLEYQQFLKKVTVKTTSDTRIVGITVQDTDPMRAMNIANAVREAAREHIRNVMDIEAVNIVEEANLPTKKSGPSVSKWTLLGGMVGVMLVCGILLIRYLMDDTIKTAEDVEKYLGLSTLAMIPVLEETRGKKKKKKKKQERR